MVRLVGVFGWSWGKYLRQPMGCSLLGIVRINLTLLQYGVISKLKEERNQHVNVFESRNFLAEIENQQV